MLVFCPVCGGFLNVRGGSSSNVFACDTCSYKLPVSAQISSKLYPKLKDLDEVLGGPSAWENAEVTEEQCPRCANRKAYFMQIQTRSADEPATIFYRCANNECTYRWKD